MNKKPTPEYRTELKFLVNEGQAALVKERLKEVLAVDRYAVGDGYQVTSLYFDDANLTSYYDKLNGVARRAKYRVRCYNLDRQALRFEIKRKLEGRGKKYILLLTEQEYGDLGRGKVGFWSEVYAKRGEELAKEMMVRHNLCPLKPKIVVDYHRAPLIWRERALRVTLDSGLRYACNNWNIFAGERLFYQEVLPRGMSVLEVKYSRVLLAPVRRLLADLALFPLAVSKYTLALQLARGRYQVS